MNDIQKQIAEAEGHIDCARDHLGETPAYGNDPHLWCAVQELSLGLRTMKAAVGALVTHATKLIVNDLNRSVTSAILHAKSCRPGSEEAKAAYRDVWHLEEAIAAAIGPDNVEGEIARVGAVTAAFGAGDLQRAADLAERYLNDALSDDVRWKMKQLHDEAMTDLARRARAEAFAAGHGEPGAP